MFNSMSTLRIFFKLKCEQIFLKYVGRFLIYELLHIHKYWTKVCVSDPGLLGLIKPKEDAI